MAALATAQSFVPPPKNVEVLLSGRFPGASISYKQVHNFCETTESVRSFSGYVSLPKDFIPDAVGWDDGVSGHYFFWYFGKFQDRDDKTTVLTFIQKRLEMIQRMPRPPFTSAEVPDIPPLTARRSSPAS